MKPYRLGMCIGRFQHIHRGHEVMINYGIEMCDNLIVIVGSEQEHGTKRNPFSATLRKKLISKIFKNQIIIASIPDLTNENDHSEDWGRFLLTRLNEIRDENHMTHQLDVLVFGNDEERGSWFNPMDIENVSYIQVPRTQVNISATLLRKWIAENNFELWKQFVNQVLWNEYEELRSILINSCSNVDSCS